MKLLVYLLAVAFPLLGGKLGMLWERANLHMENVTVGWSELPPQKGTLTRTGGLYQLETSEGVRHLFKDYHTLQIDVAPKAEARGSFSIITNMWRTLIALLGASTLGILIIRAIARSHMQETTT